jgi:20S proteasome alpha/beta subunit
MSLGIAINGPEGVVLAADTRLSVVQTRSNVPVRFDNASKLLVLGKNTAAVTYGVGSIGGRSAHSLIPEFRREALRYAQSKGYVIDLDGPNISVKEYAVLLGDFFAQHWTKSGAQDYEKAMSFIVGGTNPRAPYGEIYQIASLDNSAPVPAYRNTMFGMTWGGQVEFVNRIVKGYDPSLAQHIAGNHPGIDANQLLTSWEQQNSVSIPYNILPLQDCVDLAGFLIRATISMQSLSLTDRGVGGTVELVTVTSEEGVQWVQKREIRGMSRD